MSKHESITCSYRSLEAIFIGIEVATWVNFPIREITMEKGQNASLQFICSAHMQGWIHIRDHIAHPQGAAIPSKVGSITLRPFRVDWPFKNNRLAIRVR